jgi:hypothetical protein
VTAEFVQFAVEVGIVAAIVERVENGDAIHSESDRAAI